MKLFSATPLAFLLSVAGILASPDVLRDAGLHLNSSIYGSGRNQIAERAVTININSNAQVELAALQLKLHKAQEFCSTYLHISPYAATATKFGTATATATAPGPTLTQVVHVTVTKTAPPSFVTKTTLSVVDYVLTATRTQIDVVPTTVTVATVTSLTTVELPTIVDTVTIFTPVTQTGIAIVARQTGTRTTSAARITVTVPAYLLGTLPTIISRACSRIVTPKTTTITATRTVTNTVTNKASTLTDTLTDQPVVTPTSTLFVPSISTRTVGTVLVPVTQTSLSTVPATVTDVQPTTILIPTSTTIYLPSSVTEIDVQPTNTPTPSSTTTDLPSTVTDTDVQPTTTLDPTTTTTDLPSTTTETDIQPTSTPITTSTTTDLPNPTPSLSRGYLRARKVSDSSVLGLVRARLGGDSIDVWYTNTPDTSGDGALIVALPEGWMYGSLMDFNTENGDAINPRIGAVSNSGGSLSFIEPYELAYLSPVAHVDIDAQANNRVPAESQIWTLNQDLSVTATWTEPARDDTSAQAIPATLFYSPVYNLLGIINDATTINEILEPSAFVVTFEFVPIEPVNSAVAAQKQRRGRQPSTSSP